MIADAHIDTLSVLMSKGLDFGDKNSKTHADLHRLLRTGVGLQICALFTMPSPDRSQQLLQILRQVAFARSQFASNRDRVLLATDREQIAHLAPGKLTVVLSVEGGGALAGELDILNILFDLGVRALTLTWNSRNELADGVGDLSAKGGLTRFGRNVVTRMEQLGMVIDVSHLSEPGFWDVMETADGPVIASHSNAKALCRHDRNLTDAQLKALAERGGFVGLNFCPAFLNDSGRASIDDVVRHALHIAEVAGVEVLGFGSDFDGINQLPEGVADVTGLKKVVEALALHFTSDELEAIKGKNLQRVLSSVLPSGF